MPKRVLVTGGAGFVGSHTVDALLERGHDVRVFDSFTRQVHADGVAAYLPTDAEVITGDMRDIDAIRKSLKGIDVVYHLAAAVGVGQSMYEIAHYMGANTQGTANLLQALLDCKVRIEKLIVASSMSIYGEGEYECLNCGVMAPPPRGTQQLMEKRWEVQCARCGTDLQPTPTRETKPLQCTSIYALSKKDQEEMTLLFGRTYGIPVVALRYFNIYGTRQALSNPYTGVAAIFASRLLNNNSPLVFEDGQQRRDFVSVHDVVAANLLAMDRREADGLAINVGSGQTVTVEQVARTLAEALGSGLAPLFTQKYRAGDIRHCIADISLARELLGYEPGVRFRDGVCELVQWLRSQTAEDKAGEAVAELTAYGLTA